MEYTFPYLPYASVMQSIICSALIGVVGYLLAFHTRPLSNLLDKPPHPTFMGVPSTMLALILAFMVSSVWQNASSATVTLQNERIAIQRLLELPFGAKDIGAKRTTELNKYVSLVKDVEWGGHYNTVGIKEVDDSIKRLKQLSWEADMKACGNNQLDDLCQSAAVNTVYLNTLLNLETAREQRLSLGSWTFSAHLVKWVSVHLLALATVFTIAVVHRQHRQTAIVAITIFCICICLVFSMIGLHIHPYMGLDALTPSLLTSRG